MPIMTFTRGSLIASRQVADVVARHLKCDIVTREEVIDHARKYGLAETGMAETDFMEKRPPQFWDRHASKRRLYLIYMRASLMDYMVKGNIIYLGHLGQFVLAGFQRLLRVRIGATLELRVRALMEESKMPEAEAREHIEKIDARRQSWAKFLYGADYDSPRHYDLVLNLQNMSLESASQVIVAAVKCPEWELDETAAVQLKNLHVSSVLTARLAKAKRTRGMELDVECDHESGLAKIRGMSPLVGAATWENDIKDVALAMDGISTVEIIDLR